MSERANFRGGGRGHGGGRGGRGGGRGGHQGAQSEKPKKENILDLSKYINKEINVKFNGGRESMSDQNMCSPSANDDQSWAH
jgi:U6 snRNA-associated Sm-like protein LSm7